jgi:hypothetical protein
MSKFFLMTRGRTGSTAVIDELNKSNVICATQELFLNYNFDNLAEFDNLYDLLLPFDLWKEQTLTTPFANSENDNAKRYLEEAELFARNLGAASFGFKVLSHHFDERPFLDTLLKEHDYKVIYLTRNIANQVLSGMVANQSGLWNTKENAEVSGRYVIDLNQFQQNIELGINAIQNDYALLTTIGFSFIVVSYEEFCTNRESFYEKIFHFLGLPMILPPRSDWSIILKDLRHTVANFDEVFERATEIGMPLNS